MTNCESVRTRLADWAEDRLPADQAAEIESHLAGCLACEAALAEPRPEDAWLPLLPPPPSDGLRRKVLAARVRGRPWIPAAAAALVLAFAGAYTLRTSPTSAIRMREPERPPAPGVQAFVPGRRIRTVEGERLRLTPVPGVELTLLPRSEVVLLGLSDANGIEASLETGGFSCNVADGSGTQMQVRTPAGTLSARDARFEVSILKEDAVNKPTVLGGAAVALAIVAGTAHFVGSDGKEKSLSAPASAIAAPGRGLQVIDPVEHARLQTSLEKTQARIRELEAGSAPVPPAPVSAVPATPQPPHSPSSDSSKGSPVRIFSDSREQCGLDDAVAWFLKKHGLPVSAGEALKNVLRQEMDAYAQAVAQWLDIQKAAHPGLSGRDILGLEDSQGAIMKIREEVRGRFTDMLKGAVPPEYWPPLAEIFRNQGSRIGVGAFDDKVYLDWDTTGKGLNHLSLCGPGVPSGRPPASLDARVVQALDRDAYRPAQEAAAAAGLSEAQSRELSGACREILDAAARMENPVGKEEEQARMTRAASVLVRLLGQEKAQEVVKTLLLDATGMKP